MRRDTTSRARATCKFLSSGLLATIAFFATSTVSTHAQTNWTGAFSNGWFNPLNWDAGVPGVATDANINTVTPNSTEIRGAGATALNLSLGANGHRNARYPKRRHVDGYRRVYWQFAGRAGHSDRLWRRLQVDERRNPRGRRPRRGHAYHPKRRCSEQRWRRLGRIARLWGGHSDRPGLHLEQHTCDAGRAQYRQFWHGVAYDHKRWDGQ